MEGAAHAAAAEAAAATAAATAAAGVVILLRAFHTICVCMPIVGMQADWLLMNAQVLMPEMKMKTAARASEACICLPSTS